jgi:uncharacterized membrane protein YhhN
VIPGIVVTALGTAGLLVAEWRDSPSWRWLFKPLASAGFLLAAVRAPGLQMPTGAGWLLLAGLVLSAAGDVLLVPKSKRAFIAGIGAFALAHVAYGVWFVTSGAQPWVAVPCVAVFLAVGHLVWRWLDPHVTGALRVPVRGYVALVSIMAACAVAYGASALAGTAAGSTAGPLAALAPALGGVLFYLSDLAVARHRFVAPAFVNRAWGLPVYYAAQLLIASAVS